MSIMAHGRTGGDCAAPDAGAAARGAALPLRPQGLQRQRHSHRGGRLYPVVAERGGVPCPRLRGAANRHTRRDVLVRDWPANRGATARKARGPTCRRGANVVHLPRRCPFHAARSGTRYLVLGRVLGDCARAAPAVRQRCVGGPRVAPRSGTTAHRSRWVGARSRHHLPGAPHRQPFDVPRRRRDVRHGDEGIPPRLPHRLPAATGGRAIPLPGWHWALSSSGG